MSNIVQIFLRDTRRIRRNVIAWIVLIGITIVPCLYAWFNIAASWDPYENTGQLKVAVASEDIGYEGELIPLNLNVGEKVLSALRENTQMGWTFTDAKSAYKGVQSGEYYAAIVIPENFSKDMMSLFGKHMTKPEIIYYENQKKNAIAPKVTGKGASAVQKQVNEVFIETISNAALEVANMVSKMTDTKDYQTVSTRLEENLRSIEQELSAATDTVGAFANMADATSNLLDTTGALLGNAGDARDRGNEVLGEVNQDTHRLKNALDTTTNHLTRALNESVAFYDRMSQDVTVAYQSVEKGASDLQGLLEGFAADVEKLQGNYVDLNSGLTEIAAAHSDNDVLYSEIGKIQTKVELVIEQQKALANQLEDGAEAIGDTSDHARLYQDNIETLLNNSSDEITGIKDQYEENVKGKLTTLGDELDDTQNWILQVLGKLDASTSDMETLSDNAAGSLDALSKALHDAQELLENGTKRVGGIIRLLTDAVESGNQEELKKVLNGNPEEIASFLAAPVQLTTSKIYPVENYGSAMAPFYSVLSIWVGGIVLVAMLRVNVSEKSTEGLKHVKHHQRYLGRYIIFFIMGILQSTLICLGDLYYLGIQCLHPFLFLLAGWFTSVVFVHIIYTLTVSFGDVGKAICVVLLVMQVAGSGGTFPIEMAPELFRKVYPLLPFTHSMNAMRECVAGMYGNTYWKEMGYLSIFLMISLLMGLVLRKPIMRLNELFTEKLESTKLM